MIHNWLGPKQFCDLLKEIAVKQKNVFLRLENSGEGSD